MENKKSLFLVYFSLVPIALKTSDPKLMTSYCQKGCREAASYSRINNFTQLQAAVEFRGDYVGIHWNLRTM